MACPLWTYCLNDHTKHYVCLHLIRLDHKCFCLLFIQGIYVTRVTKGGPAEVAGLMMGDKIMQVRISDIMPHGGKSYKLETTWELHENYINFKIISSTRGCSPADVCICHILYIHWTHMDVYKVVGPAFVSVFLNIICLDLWWVLQLLLN